MYSRSSKYYILRVVFDSFIGLRFPFELIWCMGATHLNMNNMMSLIQWATENQLDGSIIAYIPIP